jgi:hypothetical protein
MKQFIDYPKHKEHLKHSECRPSTRSHYLGSSTLADYTGDDTVDHLNLHDGLG